MLGEEIWMQGRREEGLQRVERAAELLEDAPASRSKAYVLCNVARFLRNDGRDEEAIRVGRTALAMAEELGLEELCANALCTLGVARAESGDLSGVHDLERSLELAREVNSPEAVRAYLNLGSILARLGDLPRAFELHAEGRGAAEQFGDLVGIRWLQAEQLYEDYWLGRTEAALRRAEEIMREVEAGTPHRMELDARFIRGWIRLERGEVAEAEEDARRGLEFARAAGDPQALFPALAFAGARGGRGGEERGGRGAVRRAPALVGRVGSRASVVGAAGPRLGRARARASPRARGDRLEEDADTLAPGRTRGRARGDASCRRALPRDRLGAQTKGDR